jgi:hypothetical protein
MSVCERLRLYYIYDAGKFWHILFFTLYINARQKIDNSNMLPSAQTRL